MLRRPDESCGASAEALAFTHAVHNNGYMQAFRPVGQIAVASVVYPFRANENSALLIVNGEPALIDVDSLNTLLADQMKADPAYQGMLKEHSNATLWPGDRESGNNLLALAFADGSRRSLQTTGFRPDVMPALCSAKPSLDFVSIQTRS